MQIQATHDVELLINYDGVKVLTALEDVVSRDSSHTWRSIRLPRCSVSHHQPPDLSLALYLKISLVHSNKHSAHYMEGVVPRPYSALDYLLSRSQTPLPMHAMRMRNVSAAPKPRQRSTPHRIWVRPLGKGYRSSALQSVELTMATEAETAVTTQPRSKRKEIEQFVRDLDPLQVVGKSQ